MIFIKKSPAPAELEALKKEAEEKGLSDKEGYDHLKNLSSMPWFGAALASWGIAFFEYMIQVPANRIGYTVFTLPQLKIMQEVIALGVFIPFVTLYMGKPLNLNFLWASLCLLGAVYFMFK